MGMVIVREHLSCLMTFNSFKFIYLLVNQSFFYVGFI